MLLVAGRSLTIVALMIRAALIGDVNFLDFLFDGPSVEPRRLSEHCLRNMEIDDRIS